jgi:hypothetical protein
VYPVGFTTDLVGDITAFGDEAVVDGGLLEHGGTVSLQCAARRTVAAYGLHDHEHAREGARKASSRARGHPRTGVPSYQSAGFHGGGRGPVVVAAVPGAPARAPRSRRPPRPFLVVQNYYLY